MTSRPVLANVQLTLGRRTFLLFSSFVLGAGAATIGKASTISLIQGYRSRHWPTTTAVLAAKSDPFDTDDGDKGGDVDDAEAAAAAASSYSLEYSYVNETTGTLVSGANRFSFAMDQNADAAAVVAAAAAAAAGGSSSSSSSSSSESDLKQAIRIYARRVASDDVDATRSLLAVPAAAGSRRRLALLPVRYDPAAFAEAIDLNVCIRPGVPRDAFMPATLSAMFAIGAYRLMRMAVRK